MRQFNYPTEATTSSRNEVQNITSLWTLFLSPQMLHVDNNTVDNNIVIDNNIAIQYGSRAYLQFN